MSEFIFSIGDKVKVIEGTYKGRTGKIHKKCSVVFQDYCRILFDLKPRERTQKTALVEKKFVEVLNES